MSAEKCPHCGSKFTFGSTLWFECNTHVRGKQSKTCERLCELTATKANLADALADAASWQKQADDRLNDAVEFGRRAEKAEARVKELEGLAIGNERREDDGVWVEVFIPIERLGGADCEGEESPTLGDAMPRKDP